MPGAGYALTVKPASGAAPALHRAAAVRFAEATCRPVHFTNRCSAPKGNRHELLAALNQLKPGVALCPADPATRKQWRQHIVQEGDQILLFHVL